jgi:DNA-binding winged helix-turn-helix (wHTH) protein
MKGDLFGFLIDDNIQIDINSNRIVKISVDNANKSCVLGAVTLTDIMMNLLIYLLENSKGRVVSKEELLEKVWDEHELRSSTQRLWQIIKGLKSKLAIVGVPDDFISSCRGQGYIVQCSSIKTLYSVEND